MMAHFAIRGLMHEAALKADEDPDRLSFLHAVRVVRRKLNVYGAIPPSAEENISERGSRPGSSGTSRVEPQPAQSPRSQAQDEQLPAPPAPRQAAAQDRHQIGRASCRKE